MTEWAGASRPSRARTAERPVAHRSPAHPSMNGWQMPWQVREPRRSGDGQLDSRRPRRPPATNPIQPLTCRDVGQGLFRLCTCAVYVCRWRTRHVTPSLDLSNTTGHGRFLTWARVTTTDRMPTSMRLSKWCSPRPTNLLWCRQAELRGRAGFRSSGRGPRSRPRIRGGGRKLPRPIGPGDQPRRRGLAPAGRWRRSRPGAARQSRGWS